MGTRLFLLFPTQATRLVIYSVHKSHIRKCMHGAGHVDNACSSEDGNLLDQGRGTGEKAACSMQKSKGTGRAPRHAPGRTTTGTPVHRPPFTPQPQHSRSARSAPTSDGNAPRPRDERPSVRGQRVHRRERRTRSSPPCGSTPPSARCGSRLPRESPTHHGPAARCTGPSPQAGPHTRPSGGAAGKATSRTGRPEDQAWGDRRPQAEGLW